MAVALLRGRTLPSALFQKPAARETRESTSEAGSRSGNTQNLWDVVVFLEVRDATAEGVPIALLPLPDLAANMLRLYVYQLRQCRSIVILTAPQAYAQIQHATAGLHPGIVLYCADMGIPAWTLAVQYQRLNPTLWEADTVTLWWHPGVVLEHQLLWRPSTDVNALVAFLGDEAKPIALAWQATMWPTVQKAARVEDMQVFATRCTQRVWHVSSEFEYFRFIAHRMEKQ